MPEKNAEPQAAATLPPGAQILLDWHAGQWKVCNDAMCAFAKDYLRQDKQEPEPSASERNKRMHDEPINLLKGLPAFQLEWILGRCFGPVNVQIGKELLRQQCQLMDVGAAVMQGLSEWAAPPVLRWLQSQPQAAPQLAMLGQLHSATLAGWSEFMTGQWRLVMDLSARGQSLREQMPGAGKP